MSNKAIDYIKDYYASSFETEADNYASVKINELFPTKFWKYEIYIEFDSSNFTVWDGKLLSYFDCID